MPDAEGPLTGPAEYPGDHENQGRHTHSRRAGSTPANNTDGIGPAEWRPLGRAAAFLFALAGTMLPVLAVDEPEGILRWLLLVAGAVAMGSLAAGAVSLLPQPPEDGTPKLPPARERRPPWLWRAVGVATIGLMIGAIGSVVVPDAVNRVSVSWYGCPHPVELRVLTSPASLASFQEVAEAYEHHSAEENLGCPTANLFVYAAPAPAVRDVLGSGWPDIELVHWPRPDVWLADSGTEVDEVNDALGQNSEPPVTMVDRTVIASTPLVLAVPDDSALRAQPESELSWQDLWRRVADRDWGMVRPGATTPVGRIATAALYQGRDDLAENIERDIVLSVARGRYPADEEDAVLCHYRTGARSAPAGAESAAPQRATLILTEQAVIRYNQGELGAGVGCRTPAGAEPPANLVALYPDDTVELDRVFVRLAWGNDDGPQGAQARKFLEWLRDEDEGQRAQLRVGLRPPELELSHPISRELGATPSLVFGPEPSLTAVQEAQERRQEVDFRGRLLVLLDASGSMDEPAEGSSGTRFNRAIDAVVLALQLMIPGDAFGVSVFHGEERPVLREAVPITSLTDAATPGQSDGSTLDALATTTRSALEAIQVGGWTPLYRAIDEGIRAVGPGDGDRKTALVVITDGKDSVGGVTPQDLDLRLDAERSPTVFVIVVGPAGCAALAWDRLSNCYSANFDDLEETVNHIASAIWGGS